MVLRLLSNSLPFRNCFSSFSFSGGSFSLNGSSSGGSFSFGSSSSGGSLSGSSIGSLLLHGFGVATATGNEQGCNSSEEDELLGHWSGCVAWLFLLGGSFSSGGSFSGGSFSSSSSFGFSGGSSSSFLDSAEAVSGNHSGKAISRCFCLGLDLGL